MLKSLITSSLALIVLNLSLDAHALTLIPISKRAAQGSEASPDTAIIIRFGNKLDTKALRKNVSRSIQARNLSRKELRNIRRKITRSSMLHQLRDNLDEPKAILGEFLAQQGIERKTSTLWAINALAVNVPQSLIPEIQRLPGVMEVTHDTVYTMSIEESEVPAGEPQWNLIDINAPQLWEQGLTGEGVVVGIMDTGVDLNHPDLIDRWRGGENSWFDPYEEHTTPTDLIGHGTQVTGIVVGGDYSGYQIGVAPDAKWIAAKIFDDANGVSLSKIHEAFQWMLDPDGDPETEDAPDIVNNSWGLANTINECNQEFSEDIDLLREAGIAVVFAAGNFGPLAETSISPANDPNVISVGSINLLHDVENSSSRGPGACDGATFPIMVAPGDGIFTADRLPHNYNVVSGTSFASPHVAGAIAQLIGEFPDATASQIESALTDTALDLDEFGNDYNTGYGLLDVAAAYEWLLNAENATEAGIFIFSEETYSIDEYTSKLLLTVRRLGGSTGDVTVDYQSHDDTADSTSDMDYLNAFGTLTFHDGETTRNIEIIINDDTLDEDNELFLVQLSNPQGGAILGSRIEAPVTILDDDGPGSLSLESFSYAVNEGAGSFDLSVFRTGGLDGTISVDFSTVESSADSASDFHIADGTLVFQDRETSKTITLELIDDDDFEENETFDLVLSNVTGGADLDGAGVATITILDDDIDPSIPNIAMESDVYSISEEERDVQVKVTRSGGLDSSVSVEYTTTDGSAIQGEDYEKISGTLIFPTGVSTQTLTLNIQILDDGTHEDIQTFSIALFNADNGAMIRRPSASVIRIVDNDPLPFVSPSSAGSPGSSSGTSPEESPDDDNDSESKEGESSSGNKSYVVHEFSLTGYRGLGIVEDEYNTIDDTASTKKNESTDCNTQNSSTKPETTGDPVNKDCKAETSENNATKDRNSSM